VQNRAELIKIFELKQIYQVMVKVIVYSYQILNHSID
jgi:hypothetical protein